MLHLVANICRQFNEVFFDSDMTRTRSVLPATADLADLPYQSVVQAVEQTLPFRPVLCVGTWTNTDTQVRILLTRKS